MIGPTSWLLLTLTIQVTVLAIAIGLIQKIALGNHPKAAARLIAFGMLLLMVVSAAITLPLPSWFDAMGADSSAAMAVMVDEDDLASLSSLETIDDAEFFSEPNANGHTASLGNTTWVESVKNMASQFFASVFSTELTKNGVICFGVCFLVLCVVGFGRLVLGFLSLRRLRLSSTVVSCETSLAMSKILCQKIGCDREIEFLQTPLVGTAATIGLWKPKVFLADDFDHWKQAEKESVLAHEIAHIHHGDFAANVISQVCTSMHFFNPAVHWLVGQMRLNQEVAADQVASQATSGPNEYARTLATLALRQDSQNQLRLASMFMPNQNSFVRRIEMLPQANRKGSAAVHWVTFLATTIAAFAISGIRAPVSTLGEHQDVAVTETASDEGTQSAASETVDSTETKEVDEAEVLLARQLIRKNREEGFDESRHQQALELLLAAIDADAENLRAKVNLVDLYLVRDKSLEDGTDPKIENLKHALKWLESITADENFTQMEQVLAMPQLVNVYVMLGEEAKAKQALSAASSKLLTIAKKNPEIYEIWFSLVQCATVVKDYEMANEFIKTAYQTVKTQEVRRKVMQLASLVYIQNADDFKDISTEANFRNRLFALCKAIAMNPRDVKIYDRMVEYLDVEVDAEKRDVWLRNSVLDCPIPGVVHILIGARSLLRDNVNEGKAHWDIAKQQFGTTEFVTHRLLSIAIRKNPKCGEGKLLDGAILLFPDQYMLYETRGTIKKREAMLLLGQQNQQAAKQKFEEAIEDFKIVVEKVPTLITANKHLADCYEKIGDTDNMAIHTKRVSDALDKVDEKKRQLYQKVLDKMQGLNVDASALELNQLANQALIHKQFAEAIRYYEKARKKLPKDSAILNNLAFTYIVADDDHRNLELALQLVDEAIENLPADIEPREKSTFLHTKATALKQSGQFEEALALFEQGLEARPDHMDSLKSVIECYLGLNLPPPERYVERLRKVEDERSRTKQQVSD